MQRLTDICLDAGEHLQALQLLVLLTCITAAKAQNNVNYYDINALFGVHVKPTKMRCMERSDQTMHVKGRIASQLACHLSCLQRALRMHAMCQCAHGLNDRMQLCWLQAP